MRPPLDQMGGRRRIRRPCWVWLAVAGLLWCGCAAPGPFLQPSQRVTDQFEAGMMPDQYRYFIIAGGARPHVLLGVLPEFAPPAGGRLAGGARHCGAAAGNRARDAVFRRRGPVAGNLWCGASAAGRPADRPLVFGPRPRDGGAGPGQPPVGLAGQAGAAGAVFP